MTADRKWSRPCPPYPWASRSAAARGAALQRRRRFPPGTVRKERVQGWIQERKKVESSSPKALHKTCINLITPDPVHCSLPNRRLSKRSPMCKHGFLPRDKSRKVLGLRLFWSIQKFVQSRGNLVFGRVAGLGRIRGERLGSRFHTGPA